MNTKVHQMAIAVAAYYKTLITASISLSCHLPPRECSPYLCGM